MLPIGTASNPHLAITPVDKNGAWTEKTAPVKTMILFGRTATRFFRS